MRYLFLALLVALCLTLVACSLTATLVPVDGPLSKLRPVPIFNVRANGVGTGHGHLTTAINQASCTGQWSVTRNMAVGVTSGSLFSQYGSTYLSGYSVAVSGKNEGQALMTCTDGRVLQVEFVGSGNHGYGLAKDSENNIYKFIY